MRALRLTSIVPARTADHSFDLDIRVSSGAGVRTPISNVCSMVNCG